MQPYEMLEHKWSYYNNLPSENMVCCSSGTAALHLALEALQLPSGSEVIVPDFAFIACARAVTLAGLVPVFVDVRDDLLINVELVQQYVEECVAENNDRIRAILAVHTYGRRCDMDNLHAIAQQEKLYVIEDLAECHGVAPHPHTHAAVWSFHSSKVVRGEEGGAVFFRDPECAITAKCLRTLGHTVDANYVHIPRGHNYRMSNLHASVILDSLTIVNRNLEQRRRIENWYNEYCPKEWLMLPRDCPWTYDIRIPGMVSEQQGSVVSALQASGISARHAFKPLSNQAEYRCCRWHRHNGISVADLLSQEIIRLPINPFLPPWQVHKSARECFDIIRKVLSS